jgi:hypothetical protein
MRPVTASDQPGRGGPRFDGLALWIFFSCWCTLAGWVLSAAGCLNAGGYLAALVPFAAVLVLFRSWLWGRTASASFWSRIAHTRRQPPRLWFALTLLAFTGGLLYHPVNYDYLTYRFPRVLDWCWEQKWHWIATVTSRLNISATGFEWMMMPLFAIFKTDRLFFLLNFLPYLFLPGLVFSVFRGLGIGSRISWWWMWVLPSGYCFILQAAGAANDAVGAIYLLASFHYLFAAEKSPGAKNRVLACLAVALTTGVKASNLPLVLPWLVAVWLSRRTFLAPARLVIVEGMVLAVAAAVSFLPIALLNLHFAGDYAGDPQNLSRMKLAHPIGGIIGNGLQFASANLAPPLWPENVSLENAFPPAILQRLRKDFPRLEIGFGEMQTEEAAGTGLGVTLFSVMILAYGVRAAMTRPRRPVRRQSRAVWIVTGAAAAFLIYMAKMGSESTARLLAAYYPLLFAGLSILAGLDGLIVRRLLFKTVGILSILSALPLVVLGPSRPLFPAALVSSQLEPWGVSAARRERFDQVYTVYAARYDGFQSLRLLIPDNERAVGFVHAGDDPAVSLWLPFGSRRVVDLTPDQSRDDLNAFGIREIVVNETWLENVEHIPLDQLLAKWSADVVMKTSLVIKIHRGGETWCLIRCR